MFLSNLGAFGNKSRKLIRSPPLRMRRPKQMPPLKLTQIVIENTRPADRLLAQLPPMIP
jgi:hypothetical protein